MIIEKIHLKSFKIKLLNNFETSKKPMISDMDGMLY